MILIDPELDLSAAADALKPASARRFAADVSSKLLQLPSTRTLAGFLKWAQDAVRLRGQVTVVLTTDAAMRDLNRRFRGKNKPTDVLSFPADTFVQRQEKGDLAISVETARRQSVEQGHSLATELKVLILHGVLHLAGYDHETDAGEMLRREESLRARLGLPLGLIERASFPTLSQRTRKDGARSGRDGARNKKATAGPSTRPGKPGLAQDDKSKRAAKPSMKSANRRSGKL